MFIMSALAKRGPFHAAKVVTFAEMCNTLKGIFNCDKKKEATLSGRLFL